MSKFEDKSEAFCPTKWPEEASSNDQLGAQQLRNEPSFHTKSSLVLPSLPIKSTFWLGSLWRSLPSSFRMIAYRCLLYIGEKLKHPNSFGRVRRLPFNMYCKFGGLINKDEVLATMFVQANTTIPVPTILDVIGESDEELFVLMSRVPGDPVHGALNRMDAPSLALFESDLRDWLFQLRSLVPLPSTVVGGFLGTPSMQFRIAAWCPIGPYSTKEDLHEDLLRRTEDRSAVESVVKKSHGKPHMLCFTHGDLRHQNLLMQNGRLSGLVDWGSSGWFPEYWDYTGACYANKKYYPRWIEVFSRIFPQYRDELEVDRALWMQINPY